MTPAEQAFVKKWSVDDSGAPCEHNAANMLADLIALLQQARAEEREACAKVVPMNWCHPLLTGQDGLGDMPWYGQHIEKLLQGIAAAIRGRA